MRIVSALLALGFGLTFAYGWACRLMPIKQRGWMVLLLTTFGLSLGFLTLWMFWIALIWPGRLSLLPTLIGCAVVCAIGLFVSRRDLQPASWPGATLKMICQQSASEIILVVIVILTCIGIVFNAVYWPFGDEDVLVIYAPLAKEIFQTGMLPVGIHLYEGYPALVQLAYAFTHDAAGGVNEYLARLVPALMAVGSIGVTSALGHEMRSMRAGIFAAGLVALTPFFCRWASTGYTDVPGSFYFTLTALFAWRWWRDGGHKNAILTGLSAGFAMWTKNNALILPVSLFLWIVLNLPTAHLRWKEIALMAIAILATAGPWYMRNFIVFRFIIPPTIWTDAARHTLGSLLIMTWDWKNFGVIGVLFTMAIVFAVVQAIRQTELQSRAIRGMLLIFSFPFYGVWWWLASYDARFLVMIVPLLAVMAGLMVDHLVVSLTQHVHLNTRAQWLAIFCILALAAFSFRKTVNYKAIILSQPFMSDAEKHRVVLGGMYDLVAAINQLPAGARIIGVPSMALYHIDLARFAAVSNEKITQPPREWINRYDYAAYKFPDKQQPAWLQHDRPLLHTGDGYFLYSVHGGS